MPFDRKKLGAAAAAAVILVAVVGVFILRTELFPSTKNDEESQVVPTEEQFRVEEEFATGQLAFGTGGGSMSSRDLVNFVVSEGAVKAKVICDGSNGSAGLGDIDMNVYGANEGYGEDARRKTSATGGSYEVVELDEKDIEKRFGYGEYTVELINFAGVNLDYDLYMYVYYPRNGTAAEDGGEGDGGGGNETRSATSAYTG